MPAEMENQDVSPIASAYIDEINSLIDKNSKWWNEIEGEGDETFGVAIRESLNAATRMLKDERKVLNARISNFKRKLQQVIKSAEALLRFYRNQKTLKDDNIVTSFKDVAERHLKQLGGFEERSEKKFWLLRINGNNWHEEEFSLSNHYHFHSQRPGVGQAEDYHLFKIVKEGDEGLAYAYGKPKGIVFIFRITQGLHNDPHQGEIITFLITKILLLHIPLAFLFNKFSDPRLLENGGTIKLFDLNKEIFNDIISRAPSPRPRSERFYADESVVHLFADNTGGKLKDQLGFENDYKALARVVAYKKFQPPLAIGLFGNWGSGKSFFMSKLKDEIQDLADSKDEKFCKKIVQINFNSWHYSDSNLWASLITKIFEDLEKSSSEKENELQSLFNNLNSAKVLIEEAKENLTKVEGQIVSLNTRQLDLEKELAGNRKKLENVSYWEIAKSVFKSEQVQSKVNDLKGNVSFLKTDDLEQVQSKIMELNTEGGKLKETFKLAYSFKSPKLLFAVALVLGVYFGTGWLIKNIEIFTRFENNNIGVVIKGALVLLTQATIFLKPAFQKVKEVHDNLIAVKSLTDKAATEQFQNEKSVIEAEMNAAQSQKTEIGTTIGHLEAKKAEISEELKNVQSGKKLVRFIEGRVTDARYVNSLGIISWIRKDFEQLDYLLRQQHQSKKRANNIGSSNVLDALKEKQESGSFELERIILYIDDLDRCDFPIVVKVLEAIHLLLAFPLFIVVVGVDPRWMHNALRLRYQGFIANEGENGNGSDLSANNGDNNNDAESPADGIPTTFDYLEKIFQIPFVLKPIDQDGKEKLIESNLRGKIYETDNDKDEGPQQEEQSGEVKTQIADMVSEPALKSNGVELTGKKENVGVTIPVIDENKNATEVAKKSKLAVKTPKELTELLEISTEEIEFMQAMSFMVGDSPRSIKRFINIYRIIRAHPRFTFIDQNKLEHYYAAMLILGIMFNFPENANDFFFYLMSEDDMTPFNMTYENYRHIHGHDKPIPASLLDEVTNRKAIEAIEIIKIEKFKINLELISRFSFRFSA